MSNYLKQHAKWEAFRTSCPGWKTEDVLMLITQAEELESELARLRARVAILDAQEVGLPDWEPNKEAADEWWERIKDHEGGSVGAKAWYQCALSRERQLLDALRAIQACREVAQGYRAEHKEWGCVTSGNQLCGACKAYDALAGKGE